MNTIQKFIKDNNIDLTDSGSGFNASCVILAGFGLYLNDDTNNPDQVLADIQENNVYGLNLAQEEEFKKVFDFAYRTNYFRFWEKEDAHTMYIFESKKEDE